jgi:hypothetical protein
VHRDIRVRSGWAALGLVLSLSATPLVGCHASGGVDACPADATSGACASGHPDGAVDATGAACTPINPCHTGAKTSSAASSLCVDTGGLLPNGASCGTDVVCSGGTCVACTEGASCLPVSSPCHTGILDCSNGTPTCVVQAAAGPNGTTCGLNLVCNQGSCVSCAAGESCSTDQRCSVDEILCDTGVPICTRVYVFPDGTFCDTNSVCKAGKCQSCGDAGVDGGGACDAGSGRRPLDASLIPI